MALNAEQIVCAMSSKQNRSLKEMFASSRIIFKPIHMDYYIETIRFSYYNIRIRECKTVLNSSTFQKLKSGIERNL